ncbi:MAG: hypothetical protein Q9P01_02975 [Anaerolineae bacterium]|nr:hypothetical protein [Anaerolineae bacterium]MDQ7033816.1 hypothetical protein [Anaerolineae bacterium]
MMKQVYTAVSSAFSIGGVDTSISSQIIKITSPTSPASVWSYDMLGFKSVSTPAVRFFEPSIRSKDTLPVNHSAWLELEALFIDLEDSDFSDEVLDAKWLRDSRASADNRINEWYDSENWQ